MPDAADLTLDELRSALAPLLADNAGFDGWGKAAVHAAADTLGVDRDVAMLAFPGGAVDRIDAWFAQIDDAMAAALPPESLAQRKVRDRIQVLVEARLTALAPHREALRRAAAILAMPQNASRAAALGWRAADRIWRAASDTATDYNHYTKRTILAGVYAATLAVFLGDESADAADTRAFLGRRIDGILRFEKLKARMLPHPDRHFSLARFVGRLRYPAT